MAITTYAELVTAVENWITRTDLGSRIPEFIALAEGVANRELDTRQMYARTTMTIDAISEAVPTGFDGVRGFRLETTPVVPLTFVRVDDFDDTFEAAREGTGQPVYYTITGDTFLFSPTPDSSYTATLVYRKKLTGLSASSTTNWLLTEAPDIYLHGALAFAYQYIEDMEQESRFMSNFLTGIGQMNARDNRASYGSAPSRRMRGFA